jgi:hypothetical protein
MTDADLYVLNQTAAYFDALDMPETAQKLRDIANNIEAHLKDGAALKAHWNA